MRPVVTPTSPALLRKSDFTRIAANGFGDPSNSYAHSMAWFGDSLYVGTTRANLCMLKSRVALKFSVWPVNCPERLVDNDLRAQIWRYRTATGCWERVHVAPWIDGPDGRKISREIGYRAMISYQAPGDSAPCLYVAPWANGKGGQPAQILRSTDGTDFVPVSRMGDRRTSALRSLVPFRGRLFTAPVANAGVTANMPASSVVLVTQDLHKQDWQLACQPGFGDENNKTIFEMTVFNGWLYAGTFNPVRGFQLWKTEARGNPPFSWVPVLVDGAHRGNLNESVVSMCVFQDALYIGTGIQNGGHDLTYHVGPAAAEVVRVHSDDSWELVTGTARYTPDGYRAPLSKLGPGFDNFFNGYVWRMEAHAGRLYAGTCDWSTVLPFAVGAGSQPGAQPATDQLPAASGSGAHDPRLAKIMEGLLRWLEADNLVKFEGGFDLWSTADGVTWIPVTTTGFGNPYNYGLRTMASTPHGLFLGTANPFGPEVATRSGDGWTYKPNPAAGAEIWLARNA